MIEIIPAIDIIEGRCVRLSQGDYERVTQYREDPLEVALEFEAHGIKRLHLVDLDGAKANHIVNWKIIERIASKTRLVIDFGGGLKTEEDLEIAFGSGASMVTGGSIAVKNPDCFIAWIERYGADKIILGADARGNKIAVNGWKEDTREELIPFIEKYVGKGIQKVISTDIARDGMLTGPALELYGSILETFPTLHLIASGGVSSFRDVLDLEELGVPGVIIGKALYEGSITLQELQEYNKN